MTAAFAATAVAPAHAAAWHWNGRSNPQAAARRVAVRYLKALSINDNGAAYAQLTDFAREHCTLEEFIASRDAGAWTWSNLRVDRAEPGAILFAYEFTPTGGFPRTDRILFVQEADGSALKWARPHNRALMRKVEDAFNRNDAEKGLALAQTAAAVDPRDPLARSYLCEAAYYRKSPAEAERQCSAAIELDREYPSTLSPKSRYRLHAIVADTYKNALRKPELALEHFARMLAFPDISPADQCEVLLARSEAYLTLSRPGEALSDADQAGRLCLRPQDLAEVEGIRRRLGAPVQ
jgi:tetratricopeptide (TPR) repeat protein